ncbi:hypothetical protein [Paraburkholderia phenazinium]|uniref:Uncharacterized protein n=1 Tax=Paraburkholderia phenazinium TaxID=60549 RepID=A0A1G8IKN1_9BURK|nr:hypothetical protein [Paraburkholderia phenazinium]SDI19539.1 hypothetical protein SAMN05216466_118148 [Paraburkholderia phenazinium]
MWSFGLSGTSFQAPRGAHGKTLLDPENLLRALRAASVELVVDLRAKRASQYLDWIFSRVTGVEANALRLIGTFGEPDLGADKSLVSLAVEQYLDVIVALAKGRPLRISERWPPDTVEPEQQPRSHLSILLRAKIARRLTAERRGQTRLPLLGWLSQTSGETGSAAANAKRMSPHGAPPQIA